MNTIIIVAWIIMPSGRGRQRPRASDGYKNTPVYAGGGARRADGKRTVGGIGARLPGRVADDDAIE
jgi:hypothetical protein